MKFRVTRSLALVSLAGSLLAACGAGSDNAAVVDSALVSADGTVTATLSFNDWGSGYTGNVTVTNNGSAATTTWSVVLDTRASKVSQAWNANTQTSGTLVTFTPFSYNAVIAPRWHRWLERERHCRRCARGRERWWRRGWLQRNELFLTARAGHRSAVAHLVLLRSRHIQEWLSISDRVRLLGQRERHG